MLIPGPSLLSFFAPPFFLPPPPPFLTMFVYLPAAPLFLSVSISNPGTQYDDILQAAQTYWQVHEVGTPGIPRVYPEAYRPYVVGMLWSTLAQMQTWFGSEAWKVYGIQVRRYAVS